MPKMLRIKGRKFSNLTVLKRHGKSKAGKIT